MAEALQARRRQAQDCFRNGRLAEAIRLLDAVVADSAAAPRRDDRALLGLYHYVAGAPERAAAVMAEARRLWPDDPELAKNLGICLAASGRRREAEPCLLEASAADPEDANLHDALAELFATTGRPEAARHHGEQALLLKDRAAAGTNVEAHSLDRVPVPPFDAGRPERNLLSFSLWGRAERYCEGALANARLAPHLYPGWRCRFHLDASVDDALVGELLALGADVVRMPAQGCLFEGLFWRFLPGFDPAVERYLVRDADAVISLRERLAVDEWLDSGTHFHVMRDAYGHTEPMLAGLWGGVRGALPDLAGHFAGYLSEPTKTANCDQKFLREQVWPIARNSVLAHDRCYRVLGARPFPAAARMPDDRHVGQDASVHGHPPAGRLASRAPTAPAWTARERFVFTISPGRSGTRYLTELLRASLPGAEVHHERTGYHRFGVHTPEISTFTRFNSVGNVRQVRDFWRRKLALARHGPGPTYAEISHFLAKAGLIENLDLLGPDAEVLLIDLRRDVFATVWSYANRFDFANSGFTWPYTLDPDYPRRILDPAPIRRHGMIGSCLWYVAEMYCRAEYYRRLLAGHPRTRVVTVSLEEIAAPEGAAQLFGALGLELEAPTVALPPPVNESRDRPLGAAVEAEVRRLVEAFPFDPAALAAEYLATGRRLA